MPASFQGSRVAGRLILIGFLTAVLPPTAAQALASWRIQAAVRRAEQAVGALAARKSELREIARGYDVACGPGRLPGGEGHGISWVQRRVTVGPSFADVWPQDPWGRSYLLDVRGLLDGKGGLLISAGPNGTIETPLSARSPAGDDVAALVR